MRRIYYSKCTTFLNEILAVTSHRFVARSKILTELTFRENDDYIFLTFAMSIETRYESILIATVAKNLIELFSRLLCRYKQQDGLALLKKFSLIMGLYKYKV